MEAFSVTLSPELAAHVGDHDLMLPQGGFAKGSKCWWLMSNAAQGASVAALGLNAGSACWLPAPWWLNCPHPRSPPQLSVLSVKWGEPQRLLQAIWGDTAIKNRGEGPASCSGQEPGIPFPPAATPYSGVRSNRSLPVALGIPFILSRAWKHPRDPPCFLKPRTGPGRTQVLCGCRCLLSSPPWPRLA